MSRWQFRLSGTGGQGVITAAIILGEAGVLEGKEVVQTQSYGPEARGGASKAEVIIDNKAIHYPKVITPDILLAMSQQAADKYGQDIKENSYVIIDSGLVKEYKNDKAKIIPIPITQLAKENVGRELVANIVALGALVGVTEVVSVDKAKEAVIARIPKGTEEINMKAFELGLEYARKLIK